MECIMYQSSYGYTKQYAQWLSEQLSCPLKTVKEVNEKDIEIADTIIFGCSVYAGQYKNMTKFIKYVNTYPNKRFIFFSVSLTDPKDAEGQVQLMEFIEKSMSKEIMDKVQIFLLRGGIDYSKLNFMHRNLMKMVVSATKKKDTLSSQEKEIIDSYGESINYINFNDVSPLIRYIKEESKD